MAEWKEWGADLESEEAEERSETLREVKLAGIVPVPVAAMIACSDCCRSHSMVSPSVLWPSSRVSWKTRAAHVAGMRMRRPRPSTLVWRSLEERLVATASCCFRSLDLVVIARPASSVDGPPDDDDDGGPPAPPLCTTTSCCCCCCSDEEVELSFSLPIPLPWSACCSIFLKNTSSLPFFSS